MQPGFWRKCRRCLRWFRRALLAAAVAAIVAFVWFDRVGLPDFMTRRLVEALRARGVELEFSRIRLSLVRGLIAENVRLGHAAAPGSPAFSAQEVRLELNLSAALHRQWQLDGLVLREGRFVLPLPPTNSLALDHIQTDLRFQANDTWSLDHFHADFAGAQFALSGDIAHAPELGKWWIFHGAKTNQPPAPAQWQKFSDALRQIHFTGAPQLNLNVTGDARDLHSFDVRLNVSAPAVRSPWGSARDCQLAARLTAPADAPTNFDAAWSWWTNLQPYRVVWTARLTHLQSDRLNADAAAGAGYWRAPELAVTNLTAALGGGQFDAQAALNVATREFTFTNSSRFDLHAVAGLLTDKTRERLADFSWTQPPSLRAGGSLVWPAWTNREADWRAEVQPTLRLRGELVFTNGAVSGAAVDSAAGHFAYANLVWQVPDLMLAQAKTRLEISGSEDDATKDYRWHVRGTFDPAFLRPFLTASNAARGLNHFTVIDPVHLEADAWGRLYDYDRIGASGRVACTNFTVRGQSVDSVAGEFSYTNRVLEFFNPRLWRGTEMMTADFITLDFDRKLISFTNGYSTAEPQAVAQAIGPKTGEILSPYHFLQPPTVLVNGCAPLRDVNGMEDVADADLTFDIVGAVPFQCLKLNATRLAGTIHWLGQVLVLTNIAAELYGGTGTGSACFDFRVPHEGADFQFTTTVTNINLHALAADLLSPTNHLEGALAGTIVVTRADTRDWRTPDGYGQARLRDGLLWDIPVFGILSPLLNTVSPGLGNSRATEATANFAMTNGVIHSDSLSITTGTTRMQYNGTVDLSGNVNARVTAQLMRNLWVVGPLISTIFYPVAKVFECKITGTLNHPKSEPVYVPKFLLMPLHPIRSLEELLPDNSSFLSSPTNSPPAK